MHLSVVIPSGGKWPRLTACLRSLDAQRLPAEVEWEIVVVADGVEPPEDLRHVCPRARFERLPVACGRGAARNRGVRAARGEFIILLDDDMVVTAEFVHSHFELQRRFPSLCHGPIRELPDLIHVREFWPLQFATGISDKAIKRISAQVQAVVSSLTNPGHCFSQFGRESALESAGMRALAEGRQSAAWIAFAGANLSAPRDWLVQVPFNECAGTRWGLEDLALALRYWLEGRPLAVAANARALHLTHPRGSWRDDLEASAAELAFVSPTIARGIVDFLKGDAPLDALEAQLDAFVSTAGGKPLRPFAPRLSSSKETSQ